MVLRCVFAMIVAIALGVALSACLLFVDLAGLSCDRLECFADGAPAFVSPSDGATDGSSSSSSSSSSGSQNDAAPTSSRITNGLIVLYTFDEVSGSTVQDRSGVAPALDLVITPYKDGSPKWLGGALEITEPVLIRSSGPAQKIISRCKATHEATLEAWVNPTTGNTGAARVAGVAPATGSANMSIRSVDAKYYAYFESIELGPGIPVKHAMTHLVFTRTTAGVRTFYVDAEPVFSDTAAGDLSGWGIDVPMTIANSTDLTSAWVGAMYLVAMYDRALTAAEVTTNFNSGP